MIDPRIRTAIQESVRHHRQPDEVANRIIKWFEDIANGNESLEREEDYKRRLGIIFDAVEDDS